jgi:hypothetical protein
VKGITAMALIAGVVGLSGCGGGGGGGGAPSTSQVKSDLESLMLDKGLQGSVGICAHQNGNQFICQVSGTSSGTTSVQVTDDRKSIFEQGL